MTSRELVARGIQLRFDDGRLLARGSPGHVPCETKLRMNAVESREIEESKAKIKRIGQGYAPEELALCVCLVKFYEATLQSHS